MIKPLVREIHLFDSFVAGTAYLADLSVLDEIKEGDKLTLRREENKFDDNAILIFTQSGKKTRLCARKRQCDFRPPYGRRQASARKNKRC